MTNTPTPDEIEIHPLEQQEMDLLNWAKSKNLTYRTGDCVAANIMFPVVYLHNNSEIITAGVPKHSKMRLLIRDTVEHNIAMMQSLKDEWEQVTSKTTLITN